MTRGTNVAKMARGVRKVNESIMQDGRTIIITENDDRKLDWDRIPDGTLKVNPITGQIFVKIHGEGDWIPAGINHEGNLTIAKDARIVYEVFTIVRADNGDGTFTYKNEDGEHRTKPLTADGKQVFELEKGSYVTRRNKIQAYINDTLHRAEGSGGLIEIDETRVALDENKVAGTKITLKYFLKVNIGNPYPRFFIHPERPNTADYGDFWLDINEDMAVLKWWNGEDWIALKAKEIDEILGGNAVYRGFNVVPGSGRSVTINHGYDGEGALFIAGERFHEKNIISNISIPANSTGSIRTDTLYAQKDVNKLVYKIRTNSTSAPTGTIKLAEIKVPNGASSISASNITIERKALTVKVISEDIHNSTSLPTPNTLMRRDSAGRIRAAEPAHSEDVARKHEVDYLDNKKVDRAGDTMTGQLTIEGFGVLPKTTAVSASASGSNYPMGITTFNTGSLTGYPLSNSTAVNFKISNSNFTQWIYGNGSGNVTRGFFRHWTGSAWTPFKEVRDLGETADTAYRGDRGKIAYDHSQVQNQNPHDTHHDQLLSIGELDPTSTNTTKNKHLSNAQAKKWEDHVNTTDGSNPHKVKHDNLLECGELDPTSTNTTKNKHLSNAQAKKWEDHVNLTSNANPHGTRHQDLLNIEGANTSSTDGTQNKHVSNAQAKKWEDHVNAASPHSNHLITNNYTNQKIFVQSSKPTSGMKAGDIWIDTSVSYGTK